jgi:hypothetical protein
MNNPQGFIGVYTDETTNKSDGDNSFMCGHPMGWHPMGW